MELADQGYQPTDGSDATAGLSPEGQETVATGGEPSPSDSPRYTVKIDGVEQEVTLDEALAGYQRQADYTRKTQEIATMRQQAEDALRLWENFERNPQGTLTAIAQAYGYQLGEPEPEEELDPEEARWREFEQFKSQLEMERIQAGIDASLTSLHNQFGEFDDNELIEFAIKNQIPDLTLAYRAFAFRSSMERDQEIQQVKATQPPVAGGHGVQGGAVVQGGPGHPSTVREAWERAKAALGG